MGEKIFLIILCHAIGDYLFQPDFLAQTKGNNWYHLFLHCVLYAAVVFPIIDFHTQFL